MWFFTSPRTIVFGEGALEYLKELEGKKVFIVTDKNLRKLGIVDKVVEQLKETGMEIRIFDEVEPEPSKQTIERGAKILSEFGADWIIGLGGGSCMDAAKAMWVLYERPDLTIEDITPFEKLNLRKKARLINIPTTSGTGADVTWAVVITDTERKVKLELASKEVVADISILDPALVLDLPPRLTADTGMDALVHAIEAYTVQWKNDFSDALALRAVQLIFKYLPRAFKNGRNDPEAREKMHNAATMSGLAFSNSQIGIVHAMGHSLGAVFKIPHGRSVAVFLPYVMEYNLSEAASLYAEIAEAIGITDGSDEEEARKLIEAIRNLMKEIEEPLSIKEMDIPREEFEAKLDELIEKANESTGTIVNPRVPTEEDYRKLFLYAYEGKSVDF
ncbi:MAG: iron-containing alcohol dehydrogenase [Candidatus Baldrarchaeota archaeon]